MSLAVVALIGLQIYVVAFIALHDWIPLGALNDTAAVQGADPRAKLIAVTALSTLPFLIALCGSLAYAGARFPGWLIWELWITYGLALCGALRAWWVPYLWIEEPARARRYQAMFGATHAFLPERHGIRPNTLHVSLHLALLAIIALLARLTF